MTSSTVYEVTASGLNLRAQPDKAASRLIVMPRGAVVRRIAEEGLNGDWLRVSWQGRQGYAASQHLKAMDHDGESPAASPVVELPPAPPVEQRDRDANKLHPVVRDRVLQLLDKTHDANAPFRIFEAFRTPERQNWLYAQGRTRAGSKVTNARAWQSMHQYGLAADLVLFVDNGWSWSSKGALADRWKQLHAEARQLKLKPLSFELPHVELVDVSWQGCVSGTLPQGGDESWYETVSFAAARWRRNSGQPNGPILALGDRPELEG